jgi:hypothetical protein
MLYASAGITNLRRSMRRMTPVRPALAKRCGARKEEGTVTHAWRNLDQYPIQLKPSSNAGWIMIQFN